MVSLPCHSCLVADISPTSFMPGSLIIPFRPCQRIGIRTNTNNTNNTYNTNPYNTNTNNTNINMDTTNTNTTYTNATNMNTHTYTT